MSTAIENNNSLEQNKKLVEQFITLTWQQGRFNLAKNLVRRDFKYHVSLLNQTLEYDMAAKVMQNIRDSMEDFEVMREDIIAEGNRVVTQSSFCGTLVKPMLGFKPSANVVTFSAVSFWEVKKGLILSSNTLLDTAELIRQMNHESNSLAIDIEKLNPR